MSRFEPEEGESWMLVDYGEPVEDPDDYLEVKVIDVQDDDITVHILDTSNDESVNSDMEGVVMNFERMFFHERIEE